MALSEKNIYHLKLTAFFGLISVLILVSLSSLWLHRVIFNTERFTTISTQAFSQQSSRESIGSMVASRAFGNTPLMRSLFADRLARNITQLLGTDRATNAVNRLVRESQLLFTSPRRDPIILDLTSLKPIISTTQDFVVGDSNETRFNIDDIPDTITIIDTTTLPNFHHTAIYIHLAGPLTLVLALTLSVFWISRGGKANRYKRCLIIGGVVLASSAAAVLIGPLAEPAFISMAREASSQTLLGNLYKGFITPFRNQALVLASFTVVTILIYIGLHEFNLRYVFKLSKK